MRRRPALIVSAIVLALAVFGLFIFLRQHKPAPTAQAPPTSSQKPTTGPAPSSAAVTPRKPITGPTPTTGSEIEPTNIYAHNLLLRKGPDFRVYVKWLRGQFTRSKRNVDPSFDDTGSFFLDIKTGVIRANIGDICNYLNKDTSSGSPLKNIKISGNNEQVKISGTLHKVIPIPIMISGTLSAVPENDIQLQVSKIDVMKVPVKGLLGTFHVQLADLFKGGGVPGH